MRVSWREGHLVEKGVRVRGKEIKRRPFADFGDQLLDLQRILPPAGTAVGATSDPLWEHLAKQLITGGENKLAFLDRAPKLGWGLGAVWLDWVLPVAEVLWQQHPDHEEVEGRDVKGGEVNY